MSLLLPFQFSLINFAVVAHVRLLSLDTTIFDFCKVIFTVKFCMMNGKVKTKNIKHFNTIFYNSNKITYILKLCTCKIKYNVFFENSVLNWILLQGTNNNCVDKEVSVIVCSLFVYNVLLSAKSII